MFISEVQILVRAIRLMVRDGGAVWGTPAPRKDASTSWDDMGPGADSISYSKLTANENGIIWYPATRCHVSDKSYCDDGSLAAFGPYVGELHMKCKEVGREHAADWWHIYGIKPDGSLELWAN